MSNSLNSKNSERFTEPVGEDMAVLGELWWWGGHTAEQATPAFHRDWQDTYFTLAIPPRALLHNPASLHHSYQRGGRQNRIGR